MLKVHSLRLATVLFMASACSAHDDATAASPLAIAGTWNQGARLQDATRAQTHIHAGAFSFAQKGAAFTGSGQQSGLCQSETESYAGPLATGVAFEILDGVQQGAAVRFKTPLCEYEGTLSPDGASMTGSARCTYTENGLTYNWTGDWLANREGR